MNKKLLIRRLTAFACLLAMLLSILPMGTFAEVMATQGNCGAEGDGSNLTWSFDADTGTLTISGTGAMEEFESSRERPWYGISYEVQKLVISDGVTSIGGSAFQFFWELQTVILPDSLQKIGRSAFYNCASLKNVKLPKNLSEISSDAFFGSLMESSDLSVDSENTIFCVSGGCLIKKAEKKIVYVCGDAVIPTDIEGLVIGTYAFSNYAMEELVVPSNVVMVENRGLNGNYTTLDIYFESPDTEIFNGEYTIDPMVVIHGEKGSTAEQYALKNDRLFGSPTDSFRRRGYCGADGDGTGVQWTIDTDTHSLIITGNGKMKEYSDYDEPWLWYSTGAVSNIYISEGIESISGLGYFDECDFYIENPDMLIPVDDKYFLAIGADSRVHGYKGSTAEKFVKEMNDKTGQEYGFDIYEFVLLTSHEHDYGSEWKSDSAKHWHECETCRNIIDEADHSWDDGVTVAEATENAREQKKYTCEICGAERIETIVKVDHDHNYGENWEANELKHWHECSECHDMTDIAYHSWDNGVIDNASGLMKYTCKVCGATKFDDTESHTHNFGEGWVCDESKHWHRCSGCSDKKDEADHSWDNGVTVVEATEDARGQKKFTCEVCGLIMEEYTEKLPHTHKYSENWKWDESKHWHECSGCNDKKDEADHNWDNGKLTKEPTKEADGEKLFTCSDCNAQKTEKIEKLLTPPQTGLPVGIVITAILAAVIVAAFSIGKRKQYKTKG